MTNVITNNGKNVILNRAYKASPDYTAPSKFKVGIGNGTPLVTDTALSYAIPILDGTVNDDGSNAMTGSLGGDNSTDNTTTFKPGAGTTDNTAQNLITTGSNVSKVWTIAALTANIVTTKPFGLWLYIKDATALAKFNSSGTALDIRLGSDTSNYYYKTFTAAQLTTGWNWVTSNTTLVSALSTSGTPTGSIDTFQIIITTNNASDAFVAGDVIYDLLRQWATTDVAQTFVSGYPTFDETNKEVTIRCYLTSVNANGFLLNAISLENTDSTPLVTDIDTYTAISKSDTDEIIYLIKTRCT